jgi:hypothetical protein
VAQARLKSSFIYLANAVNDLRAQWAALGIVLAPLVFIASICFLPDALNLQHMLAARFAPGLHHVGWIPTQSPYPMAVETPSPIFPAWIVVTFHILLGLLGLTVQLFVMCTIRRVQAGVQHPQVFNEAIAIYREAIHLIPAFLWIRVLQLGAIVAGFALLVIPGLLLSIWLYFAEYTLVFEGRRSFAALLRSRDLMRKRFFRVATRIVVFLAVWSGYNSWVAGAFFGVSFLIGPIGAYVGVLGMTVLLLGTITAAVGFATTAFFVGAGVRLFRDLTPDAAANYPVRQPEALPAGSV